MNSSKRSNTELARDWVLPAEIPFSELKGRDLEECVYWLLDAMGAKDLTWRTGGTSGGAADGGRDLEARCYAPTLGGELEAEKWWIECKGRTGTVEADEVRSAVNNALAQDGLDYLVVATNTQFSNPTRDWVTKWQAKHARPKVRLWDHAQLERYLSRHPDVVLRLFSKALSLDGRFRAMEERFWNKLEFVAPQTLVDLWDGRANVEFTAMGIVALIANEFAHGSIVTRPWAGSLSSEAILSVLSIGLQNLFYLAVRCSDAGVDQEVIFRSLSYLALAALNVLSVQQVYDVIMQSIARGKLPSMPEEAKDLLLEPLLGQLRAEIQDVCTEGCKRVHCFDRVALPEKTDEVPDYWVRLESEGIRQPIGRRMIRIENSEEPCVVGFQLGKNQGCPLFAIEATTKNAGELLTVIQRVGAFRKAEASARRQKKQA
jgi:Restriction endonuclease